VTNGENISTIYTFRLSAEKEEIYHHKRENLLAIHFNNATPPVSFCSCNSCTKKQKGMSEDSNTSKKDLLVS